MSTEAIKRVFMPKAGTTSNINDVVKAFSAPNETSLRMALARLKKLMPSDSVSVDEFVETLRDKRFRKGFACPHYKSEKVIRHGAPKGRQKYKCNDFSRIFSDQTHTPFRDTHYPDKGLTFMELMIKYEIPPNGWALPHRPYSPGDTSD